MPSPNSSDATREIAFANFTCASSNKVLGMEVGMKKSRILITIFAAVMLHILMCSVQVKAEEAWPWVYEINPYNQYEVIITGYVGNEKNVTVPDSINGIAVGCIKAAFYNNDTIKSVTIPDTIRRLESVYTNENGNYVVKGAFAECDNLISVKNARGIEAYAERTFENCKKLRNVKIYGGSGIPGRMFYGCKSLKNIRIPSNITKISYCAFEKCLSLKKVTGAASVTTCETKAFYNCRKLQVVNLGKIKSISEYMFYNCSNLKKVKIPNSVTDIQRGAFAKTGLTSVNIPSSVRYIGGGIYDVIYKLCNGAFDSCKNLKIVKGGKNVKIYGICAFRNCTGLKSVSLGKVTVLKREMFSGCKSLKSIKIPSTVRALKDKTFYGCTGLKKVKIPQKTMEIGKQTFGNCTSLKSMVIPKTVEEIYTDSVDNSVTLILYKNSYAANVMQNREKLLIVQ